MRSPQRANLTRTLLPFVAAVRAMPASLARAMVRAAVPSSTSRLTKYPPVGSVQDATFDAPSLFEVATDVVRERVDAPTDAASNGHDEAVALWVAAYGRDDLIPLAEVLTAVADHHMRWRFVHYQAVRRILGDKPGTAGSSGLTWLKRAVDAPVFPALWEVRSVL